MQTTQGTLAVIWYDTIQYSMMILRAFENWQNRCGPSPPAKILVKTKFHMTVQWVHRGSVRGRSLSEIGVAILPLVWCWERPGSDSWISCCAFMRDTRRWEIFAAAVPFHRRRGIICQCWWAVAKCYMTVSLQSAPCKHDFYQTGRALGGAHVPSTKVFWRLSEQNHCKPRVAAAANTYTWDFPDVKFRVSAFIR